MLDVQLHLTHNGQCTVLPSGTVAREFDHILFPVRLVVKSEKTDLAAVVFADCSFPLLILLMEARRTSIFLDSIQASKTLNNRWYGLNEG